MKEANTIPTSVHPHMMYANVHLRKVHDVNKNMTIKKKNNIQNHNYFCELCGNGFTNKS